MTDDGPARFLSRWSRRKAEHREGRTPEQQAARPEPAAPLANHTDNVDADPSDLARDPAAQSATDKASKASQAEQLPAIDELTSESDFRPFMKDGVEPSTRNAALQRLFADPHFNRICDMNTDIEDFGIFEPIPPAMLRMMDSARSLGFFSEDDGADKAKSSEAESQSALEQPDATATALTHESEDRVKTTVAMRQISEGDQGDASDASKTGRSGAGGAAAAADRMPGSPERKE